MKNYISYILVLGATFATTFVHADDEIKLKRSCIKDYPLVEGETNPELLTIYSQVCDKKNKENKNALLISAAEKFQQLGKNEKALQIVNYFETQNIQSNELTDVKFLSGIGLAYDALNKMRNSEMRYLTEEKTYPVAKNFVEAVKGAVPSTVLVEKQEEFNTPIKSGGSKSGGSKSGGSKSGGSKSGGAKSGGSKSGGAKSGGAKSGGGGAVGPTTAPPSGGKSGTPFDGLIKK